MLLNLSNHPSSSWGAQQLATAHNAYATVVDLPFPIINPSWTSEEIHYLADDYLQKVISLNPNAVHLMGEMTFTFALVQKLKAVGMTCVASTTERLVEQDGTDKTVRFEFVQFRSY